MRVRVPRTNRVMMEREELIGEPDINMLGYHYLGQKKNAMAILVFQYNTQAYPESFNTYDSLGESYMEDGNHKLAIKYYKKIPGTESR